MLALEAEPTQTAEPPHSRSTDPGPKTRAQDLSHTPHGAPDTVHIYTDGASSGNPGPAGIGVLLRYGSHEKEISRFIGEATNNIAELEAIRVGLGELKDTRLPVRLYTDSAYAHGVLTLGWKAKKNTALIRAIKKRMATLTDVRLIKVKGHAGEEGNERADHLATAAIKKASGIQ